MTTRACTKCQYPLPDLPGPDGALRCPECGTVDALGSTNSRPGPCVQCGYDLSGTPVRGDGVAWVCPECHAVSRVEDWLPRTKSVSPTVKRRGHWLTVATLLNVFALGPVVGAGMFFLGRSWPLALVAAMAMFVIEGTIFERAEAARLHIHHYRPAHIAKWTAALIACAVVGYLVLAVVLTAGRLRR